MRLLHALALATALAILTPVEGAAADGSVPRPDEVSKAELRAFLEARDAVEGVLNRVREGGARSDGGDELDDVRARVREAVAEAVEGAGLSVDRYNALYVAVQRHRQLQERLLEIERQNAR